MSRSPSAVRYPKVRQLLEQEFKQLRRRKPDMTGEAIAGKVEVSSAALSSWKLGHRAPKEKNARALARVLYPGTSDADARERFVQQLIEAAQEEESSGMSEDSFDAAVAEGLRFSYVDYGVFTSAGTVARPFLLRIFNRFVSLTRASVAERSFDFVSPAEVNDLLKKDQTHAVLGLLATPDRLATMQFLLTPITIGLNAVTGRKISDTDVGRVHGILVGEQVSDSQMERVRPLVFPEEAGHLYTTRTLGWHQDRMELYRGEFSAEAFAERLAEWGARGREEPILTALLDEYTCFEIAAEMSERDSPHTLVFNPLDNELPRYPLGIALKRGDRAVRDYVEEALSTFLDADYEWVAKEYTSLFTRLKEHAERALGGEMEAKKTAVLWAIRTLRLQDVRTPFLLPQDWRRVLLCAHEMLWNDDDRSYAEAMAGIQSGEATSWELPHLAKSA
ncbi:MAG TPA: helix-turn-helix transcriptional regulator [Longimicrobiaceae bacterium]